MKSYSGDTSYGAWEPLAASVAVEGNGLVCIDGSGNLNPASDTSGLVFRGSSQQDVTNSGAAGSVKALVSGFDLMPRFQKVAATGADATWKQKMGFFVNAAGAATAVGLAASSTNKVAAGRIVGVNSATEIVIDTWDRFTLATA